MPERWRQPFASNEAVRSKMSRQRREGTGPELALRKALHSLGLRYRVHRMPLPALRRKADIVFGPAKLAVFVDGCFWHGCPDHGRRRHDVNGWYWKDKIARNIGRDRETDAALAAAGWQVVRFWEHELRGLGLQFASSRVQQVLRERSGRAAPSDGARAVPQLPEANGREPPGRHRAKSPGAEQTL